MAYKVTPFFYTQGCILHVLVIFILHFYYVYRCEKALSIISEYYVFEAGILLINVINTVIKSVMYTR